MAKIEIVRGDLTEQRVDVIVNAANRRMRGGGGVDGAIHRKAGPALLRECEARFPQGLAAGDAAWTLGHQLQARWIVHTVGPNFRDGERDVNVLASCYRRSLEEASELGAQSIAFPIISAGAYGWPLGEAVDTAISTVRDWLAADQREPRRVLLTAFDEAMATRLEAMLWAREAPIAQPGSVAELFDRLPIDRRFPQSDLGQFRGDVYLSALVRGRLTDTPLPDSAAAVRGVIEHTIERVSGVSLTDIAGDGVEYVAALDPGRGMSAGRVSLRWWRDVMIPELLAHRGPRAADP